MRQSNPRNTKDRDQAPAQKTKKMDQRKNNYRKNKLTTKQKDACLKHRKHNHKLRGKKPRKLNKHIQGAHASEKPQNSEQKKSKFQKTNSAHLHQRMHEKKINNLSGEEWKPTTEKPKLKLETINNIAIVQSIHKENTIDIS